jgi:hypothetical protein
MMEFTFTVFMSLYLFEGKSKSSEKAVLKYETKWPVLATEHRFL